MKNRAFIDTNIFLDLILDRGDFGSRVQKFLESSANRQVKLFTSVSCIQTIIYVLQKSNISPKVIRETIAKINLLVHLTQTNSEDIERGIQSDFKDLEDAILYQTAISNQCAYFITRNIKGFPKNFDQISVLLPEKF
ncbi:type II toxin-antitoxin system VapC family toxin [Algoriphagus formosus]|uniref:type II toxin-antitoxin system VapC family toxin n=1 Tax=Algoriphagus formosus TaxID=2007308 RepID=UPI003F72A024